jgi:glutathione S-transferase
MKLFFSPASPFVRKVLIAAYEYGLAGRIEIANEAVSPVSTNATVAAANPLGKIPALALDDGSVLYDSRVIVDYLADLAGKTAARDWRGETRIALADGLMDASVLLRYETFLRPAEYRWAGWIDGQRAKIERSLDALEAEAPPADGSLSPADFGTAAALGYLDLRFSGDLPWRTGRPKLAAFMAAIAERSSIKLTAA